MPRSCPTLEWAETVLTYRSTFEEIKHILAFVTLIVLTWFYPLPVTELFFGKNCSWVGGGPDLGLKLPALLFAKGSFMFL